MKPLLIFCLAVTCAFAQWTPRGGGDHGGAAWTPAPLDTISGTHYNIGLFTVPAGQTICVHQYDGGDTSGQLAIQAQNIRILGTLDASGRGYGGGGGGQNDNYLRPGGRAGRDGRGGNGSFGTVENLGYWGSGGGGGGSPGGISLDTILHNWSRGDTGRATGGGRGGYSAWPFGPESLGGTGGPG